MFPQKSKQEAPDLSSLLRETERVLALTTRQLDTIQGHKKTIFPNLLVPNVKGATSFFLPTEQRAINRTLLVGALSVVRGLQTGLADAKKHEASSDTADTVATLLRANTCIALY